MGLVIRTYAVRYVPTYSRGFQAYLSATGGDRWRAHRKTFHAQFQPSSVSQFRPIQLKEAHAILRRLLDEPEALIDHLRL